MQPPKNHTLTLTQDGSPSLYSEVFQEGCHSSSGARHETQVHYLEGCRIEEKLLHPYPLSILEVGFGSGLGFEMTLELMKKKNGLFNYLALEIDAELALWSFERLGLKGRRENLLFGSVLSAQTENGALEVLIGNARSTLPSYLSENKIVFDAIYQDAFSPKRNPVLWTKEWFSLLRMHSRSDVILSTYSASNSIRKSLQEAGWKIQKGEAFGPKRASTRAMLDGESDPEITEQMKRSPSVAILDSHLPQELFL